MFQWNLPGLCENWDRIFTAYVRSGRVATYSHINDPNASRYGVFAISLVSCDVVGQSSINSELPGGSGVEVGAQ